MYRLVKRLVRGLGRPVIRYVIVCVMRAQTVLSGLANHLRNHSHFAFSWLFSPA